MASSGKHRFNAEMNVVPYIDVMLVLLIIFMVTAPLLVQGVQVDLPRADARPIESADEPLIVSMKRDGSLYIDIGDNPEAEKPLVEIQEAVRRIIASKPATTVLVWADHGVGYGKVVSLMTQLEHVGVNQVGLVTEPLR